MAIWFHGATNHSVKNVSLHHSCEVQCWLLCPVWLRITHHVW